jgi:hypothetical protein
MAAMDLLSVQTTAAYRAVPTVDIATPSIAVRSFYLPRLPAALSTCIVLNLVVHVIRKLIILGHLIRFGPCCRDFSSVGIECGRADDGVHVPWRGSRWGVAGVRVGSEVPCGECGDVK